MLVAASPKFQFHEFTVPGVAVEASEKATAGHPEVLNVKFAAQLKKQPIVTFLITVSEQPSVVPTMS